MAWKIHPERVPAEVFITGAISEHADLRTLIEQLPASPLIVDLADVDRINSAGVRQWLEFVERVTSSRQIFFSRMSPPIVRNLNMIRNLAGKAHVLSVVAPYMCEQCDEFADIVVDVSEGVPRSPPPPHCQKCHAEMEFADLWNMYFSFLTRA